MSDATDPPNTPPRGQRQRVTLDDIYANNQRDLAEKRRALRRGRRGHLSFNTTLSSMRSRPCPIPPMRFNDKYLSFRLKDLKNMEIDEGMMNALTTCIRQTSIKDTDDNELKSDDFWKPRITYALNRYLRRPRINVKEKVDLAMQFTMPQIRATVDGLNGNNRSSPKSTIRTILTDTNGGRVMKPLHRPRQTLLHRGKRSPKDQENPSAGAGSSSTEPGNKENSSSAEEGQGGK